MKAEFDTQGNMILHVDSEERSLLQTLKDEDPDAFGSDAFMHDWFEGFIGNSEYQWVRPEECGALTSAPMLGIYSEPRELREGENPEVLCLAGCWDGKTWVEDVEQAWAFMDYQVISVQEQLLETGQAVFQKG